MLKAQEALDKLLKMDFETILDIGSGAGEHAAIFRRSGKKVTTIDIKYNADYIGDFNSLSRHIPTLHNFDAIWCSHVLEHQENVGLFLENCFRVLKDNGILAITVPPLKHSIVGGHLTLWNAGLLLYNLILAGFDCSGASVKTYGYNISIIVRKKKAIHAPLVYDNGDIETLAHLFPLLVKQGFNGEIKQLNW